MLLFRMLFEPKTPQYTHQPQQGSTDTVLNHFLLLGKGQA